MARMPSAWWLAYLPAEHRIHFWLHRDLHEHCACKGTGRLNFDRARLLRMIGRV